MYQPVDQWVHEEMADLSIKHGRAAMNVENQFFHTTRAMRSLSDTLLANPRASDLAVLDRLVHLAAVCQRLAMALNSEETG
jgi:hypothetical protein